MTSQTSYLTAQQKFLSLQAQQSTDGRTLIYTPNYSQTGRNLTVPGAADAGLSNVDQCVNKWPMTRDQCIAAINKDVTR